MPEDFTDAQPDPEVNPRFLEVLIWLMAVVMIAAGLWLGPRAAVKPGDSGAHRHRFSLFGKH